MSDNQKELMSLLSISQDSDNDTTKEILKKIIKETINKEIDKPITKEELLTRYMRYKKKYSFKEGDIVKWKEGLQDRTTPKMNEPAIVVEVLKEPIFDSTNDAGSPYFRNAYDLILGVVRKDKFLTAYYVSSRFELYK